MSRARTQRVAPEASGPRPREGGPTESFHVERASASPRLAPTAIAVASRTRTLRPQSALAPGLAEFQRWFLAVITHPTDVTSGLKSGRARAQIDLPPTSVERIVTARPTLSAAERLGVYHHAYHARLIECLADDFPVVRYALGTRLFDRLARDTIRTRPSRHPNLNGYGRALVETIGDARVTVPHRGFLQELAQLEWAMAEVFHAQAAPTFSPAALQALPTEAWAQARLRPSETVRVLTFRYPVNAYYQDFRMDRLPGIPAKGWSATAVYRQGFTLWRMDLTRDTAGLLERLFAGMPLGAALEPLTKGASASPQLIRDTMRWFHEWVTGGFFGSLDPQGSSTE